MEDIVEVEDLSAVLAELSILLVVVVVTHLTFGDRDAEYKEEL